jgi:hypothetical protein
MVDGSTIGMTNPLSPSGVEEIDVFHASQDQDHTLQPYLPTINELLFAGKIPKSKILRPDFSQHK